MDNISFKLDVFEGPLDLLLHLISKHKLNINDIEISKLLEQYLLYIEQAKEQDLEKETGKVLSIGFQPRFDVNMQMIKKIVESGELGEVYYIQTGGGRRNKKRTSRDAD